MKSLQEFKTIVEEEKSDFSKFDVLVRAGLGNKAQIQRMHQILNKMGEENPQFNNADKAIIQNIFNKMIDLVTNNPQIYRQARRSVKEDIETSDFKLDKLGRRVRAHRIKLGREDNSDNELKEDFDLNEAVQSDAPFILLLKRVAIRPFPNGLKVATYYSDRLGREFAIPFIDSSAGDIRSANEEYVELNDGNSVAITEELKQDIANMFEQLDEENQQKFLFMMFESLDTFEQLRQFVANNK